MELSGLRICITGGGGFVGSHLADRLVDDNDLLVVDHFGNGRREWVPEGAAVIEGDLREPAVRREAIPDGTDLVFHFAADKAVDSDDPDAQFRANTDLTASVLERMADAGCRRIAFTSSSTVYGEAPRPTPEDYAPLEPRNSPRRRFCRCTPTATGSTSGVSVSRTSSARGSSWGP